MARTFDGKIAVLFGVGDNGLVVELIDANSGEKICRITLDGEQTILALSRLACTPCRYTFYPDIPDSSRLGKRLVVDEFSVDVSNSLYDGVSHQDCQEEALVLARKFTEGEDWEIFGTPSSVLYVGRGKSKKYVVNVPIRKWVDSPFESD